MSGSAALQPTKKIKVCMLAYAKEKDCIIRDAVSSLRRGLESIAIKPVAQYCNNELGFDSDKTARRNQATQVVDGWYNRDVFTFSVHNGIE